MAAPKGNQFAKGNTGGRPTKYDPKYCQMLLDDAAEGYSLSAFAGLIGVDPLTLNRWADEHEEFCNARNSAKALRLRAWEKDARNASAGKTKGAPAVIIFGLKNMGGEDWQERSTPVENTVTLKIEGGLPSKDD